jgi:hypothetical protein
MSLRGFLHSLAVVRNSRIACTARPRIDHVRHHVGLDCVSRAEKDGFLAVDVLRA